MRIPITAPLFAWEHLEDEPDLQSLRRLLDAVPDEKLLSALQNYRGRGRDDYPVTICWRVLLTSIVLRHPTMEACLAELGRNEKLRRVVGIEEGGRVPRAWNMSRFLHVLGLHDALLREVLHAQVAELARVVPDLGRDVAGDSTHLSAREESAAPSAQSPEAELPEPRGGKKEYTDETGKVTHVLSWWGYKVHLLVDRKHEVTLNYRITSATGADNVELIPLVHESQSLLPPQRIQTLAYDKAADDHKVHEALQDAGIRPLIQLRKNPNGPKEEVLLHRGQPTPFVYDEAGTVFCYDTVSEPSVKRPMAYWGHDAARGILKYRCPAKARGFACPSLEQCNGTSAFGKTVRIQRKQDLRRFPPIPRATKTFERLYKERTAIERVGARLKLLWGLEDGNVVGRARFHAHVGAVLVGHLGLARLLAATPRREGTLGKLKLSPIARALAAKS